MERLRQDLKRLGQATDAVDLERVLRECVPELTTVWMGEFGESPPQEMPLTAESLDRVILAADYAGSVDLTRAGALVERAGARWQELRTADAHREFFRSSVDLFAVAGFDGYFKLLNPAWENTLGYTLEELYSRPFVQFVHPEDRGHTDEERVRVSQDSDLGWATFENRYLHKDGGYRWFAWRSQTHLESQLIYALARDVTAEKKLTQELHRRNEELETFAYVASHDLRAPLRAVDNLSRWLEEDARDSLSGESLRHLSLLRQRVGRMENLLEALLQYSRAGRDVPIQQVEVEALLADVLELLGRPSVIVKRPLPAVQAASAGLKQIFLNLISNALKHGGTAVEVGVVERESEWEFWVADDGPGIPFEFRERIFRPFTTLKPRDEVEGTGIGLALVQRRVQQGGGRVWVEENPSGGSIFRFNWPKKVNP